MNVEMQQHIRSKRGFFITLPFVRAILFIKNNIVFGKERRIFSPKGSLSTFFDFRLRVKLLRAGKTPEAYWTLLVSITQHLLIQHELVGDQSFLEQEEKEKLHQRFQEEVCQLLGRQWNGVKQFQVRYLFDR